MKSLKIIFMGILVFCVYISMSTFSYTQQNKEIYKETLAKLIDSPSTKIALADKMDGQPNIDFDMDTLVIDEFRAYILVATLDFEHIPSGAQGTASIAYQWENMEFVRIYSSYYLWGTEVSGMISTDTTWNPTGSPYYLTADLEINPGVTLTLEPGTVVRVRKFDYGITPPEIYVFGVLNCQNATFTTSCDFENYDNSQINLEEVDWNGISIEGDGECTMENSLIEYALEGLFIDTNGDITISNCTIRRCYEGIEIEDQAGTHLIENNDITDCYEGIDCGYMTSALEITGNMITCAPKWSGLNGMYVFNSTSLISSNTISGYQRGLRCWDAFPDVTQNNFLNNFYGIYCLNGASPIVYDNNFVGNTGFGLYTVGSAVTINAENNWWGDPSGPYNYASNPSGLGDTVSDNVDFIPWLTSQVTALLALSQHKR